MQNLQHIFQDCGLNVQRHEPVHGGDINDAYCLVTGTAKYFLKTNDKHKYPGMFEKEAGGLELLRKNCSLIIPQVIRSGSIGNKQYLVLEWLEKGTPNKNMGEEFGTAMAMLHKQTERYFGLDDNNYIGSLVQLNKKHSNWEMFFAECRLLPLLKLLFDKRGVEPQPTDVTGARCVQLARHFPPEPPALLHGDLWAGNYLIHSSGSAALYDPAVYFGHREMDMGMTKLFGGFDQRFYDAYNHYYPLEKDWQKRLPLAQLYPVLVHAVLFGGHYYSQAMDTIKRFS